MSIPAEHIEDAHKLVADAQVDLFQLTPIDGGTIYFKADNEVTWQGDTYEGLPLVFAGLKKTTTGSSVSPKLTIGDGTLDLSPFKPLVHDGWLENALVTHYELLLANLQSDLPIYNRTIYRVKRVPSYSSLTIELQLATASDALDFTIPQRQYAPPAFPSVTIT